jgi:hypothetical protein
MFDQPPRPRGFSGRPLIALIFAVAMGFFGYDVLESRMHLNQPVAFAVLVAFILVVHYAWYWAEKPK